MITVESELAHAIIKYNDFNLKLYIGVVLCKICFIYMGLLLQSTWTFENDYFYKLYIAWTLILINIYRGLGKKSESKSLKRKMPFVVITIYVGTWCTYNMCFFFYSCQNESVHIKKLNFFVSVFMFHIVLYFLDV